MIHSPLGARRIAPTRARRRVKAAAVVDCQRRPAGDRLVDEPLHAGGVEALQTAVIQRRGDRLKRTLDLALALHC
jgi:hypothetical protein